MGLSEANSKNYHAILNARKRDPARASRYPIISHESQKDNGENEYYKDKTVVRQLQRPYERIFAPEEIQKMVDAYQSGKTSIELGVEYKCSKTTIVKLLRQQGVEVRKDKARAKIDDEVVINMYQKMSTVAQLPSILV